MEQNNWVPVNKTTGSGDVQSDVTTTYSSSVSINEISGGHSEASSPKQTDSLRNFRQVSVNTTEVINSKTPLRATVFPSPLPAARTPGSAECTGSMPRQMRLTTNRAAKKHIGAKRVAFSPREEVKEFLDGYTPKKYNAEEEKLVQEDNEIIQERKRRRRLKLEKGQKELEEAKNDHEKLTARMAIHEQQISSLKQTIGCGAHVHTVQQQILRHQMLIDQETFLCNKIKLQEAEVKAVTPWKSRPKVLKPILAPNICPLSLNKFEDKSLPSVGTQRNKITRKDQANLEKPDKPFDMKEGLRKTKKVIVPSVCVPDLDLSKLHNDNLPVIGKQVDKTSTKYPAIVKKLDKHSDPENKLVNQWKPNVVALPDICSQNGEIFRAKGAATQKAQDLDGISGVALLPNINKSTNKEVPQEYASLKRRPTNRPDVDKANLNLCRKNTPQISHMWTSLI